VSAEDVANNLLLVIGVAVLAAALLLVLAMLARDIWEEWRDEP
jgi:hypothetical protein